MKNIPEQEGRSTFVFWRSGGLIALLAAEVTGTSLRYDARTVPTDRPWHDLVFYAGPASRIAIAIGLFTVLAAGPRWYKALRQSTDRLERLPVLSHALAANLAAFFCFFYLSAPVVEGPATSYSSSWIVFAAWITSGLATLVLWGLAVLPVDLWMLLLERSGGTLLAGPVLGIAATGLGLLAQDRWRPLATATLWIVHGLLTLTFTNTIYRADRFEVGTPSFNAEIAPACSGYEGVGLMAAFLAVALWVFRRELRFPRSYALLPLGIALIWLANSLRIFLLIVVGTMGFPELADGGFHSIAGWVFFLLIGLGMLVLVRRSPFFSATEREESQPPSQRLDSAYLLPAMAIVATAMVTTAFFPGFDRYYPVKVIAAVLVLAFYRRSYSELRPAGSWLAVAIGFGVFALWMVMEPPDPDHSRGAAIHSGVASLSAGGAATWLFFRVVGSVIIIPVAEELAFRGYLTRRLISSDFRSIPPGHLTWLSFFASSLLFGALHGRWLAGTLAGMAYALAYHRRGELTDAIVAHGVTNGLIAALVLANGTWSLWG
jgi:exosortase E/protease (VPEID-CTERM system)